jgi:hypothetical protein
MPSQRCRRSTVFDLIVVVAAMAMIMGLYRWLYPPLGSWPIWRVPLSSYTAVVLFVASGKTYPFAEVTRPLSSYAAVVLFVTAVIYSAWPCLVVATPAFLAIRLHGAHPRTARLMCQPGTVGCLTALGFMVATGLVSWPIRAAVLPEFPEITFEPSQADQSALVMAICRSIVGTGYAVLAAWLVLALGGRWRPEWGWIDRLGWLIGVGWVAWSASYSICPHL